MSGSVTSYRSAEPEAGSSGDGASALHFDVLIVGAGISGIGAGYHLTQECPDKSFVILEAQETFGGTWWTHKYPGVRSDSDLFTFGYRFKPWLGAPIASAEEILKYLSEVIAENGLESHIRYRHRTAEASWSTDLRLWTLSVLREDTGERLDVHHELLVDVPGLLPPWRGLHTGVGGPGQLPGPGRAPPGVA